MKKYYDKIDGLRGVAILLVLVDHFLLEYFTGTRIREINTGYYGVDLFFVISGFLITSILLKVKGDSFKSKYVNFIVRRALRIFPIYYLTLLVLFSLNLPIVRDKIVYLLTYTYNYSHVYSTLNHPITHFWSLSVEEQFYLFWPVLVLLLATRKKQLLIITIAITVLSYAQLLLELITPLAQFQYVGLLSRVGSLGLGAIGAVRFSDKNLPRKVFDNKWIELGVFLLIVVSLLVKYELRPLVFGLCSFFIVMKATQYNFQTFYIERLLKSTRLKKIGEISYGIYVYHLPISYFFIKYVFDPVWNSIDFEPLGSLGVVKYHSWFFKLILNTLLSILFAMLSYRLIEKPILALKDRYFSYKY